VDRTDPNQQVELDIPANDDQARDAARRRRQHIEDMLDSALEETFPASDPPSIALPPE
jgi:hypothetical protein